MKTVLVTLCALPWVMMPVCYGIGGEGRQFDTLRVGWTVSEVRIFDRTKATEQEAAALLSRSLDIDETSITFDGKSCKNVSFEPQEVDAQNYLASRYGVAARDFGIESAMVQRVRTTCQLPGFAEYLRVPDRRIMVFRDGIALIFSPWINY